MRRQVILGQVMAVALAVPSVAQADAPLQVLATVGMVADVAANVAGSCAEVVALMGPGTDPHYYNATASDVRLLDRAEVVFHVGHGLEGRLGEILARFGARKPVVAVGEAGFGPDELLQGEDGVDPHLWMDVALWARIAPTIATTLAELRPDCAADMEANAESYGAQLQALHGWVGDSIASIPEGGRMLVTAHDAFEYYSRAYGIEASEAIEGISTESEASIGDIREVAAFVAEARVPAVFVESTINPRTIEAMVAEARALGHEVTIGGELYSDAMGDADSASGSYIGMIWHNTATITEALGGQVPPLPPELAAWAQQWAIAD